MFDHFDKRLKRDIKQIVDRRIEASETSSGSHMRVRFPSANRILLTNSLQSTGVDVNVISHKRQRYAVWFGGSLLASLVRLVCTLRESSI